jgi:hypothetical protein
MMPHLSREVELHILLELAPESWSSALFDVPPRTLPAGIMDARPILSQCLPELLHRSWHDVASLNFIVHRCPRSLHWKTLWTSHRAAQFVRRLQPDIIHVDNLSFRQSLVFWEWHDVPLILTMHDPEPHSVRGTGDAPSCAS